MNKDNALRFFKNVFLGEVDEQVMSKLSDITTLHSLKKKDILFFEGEEGSNVYFLVNGSIKLYKTNDEGKSIILKFLKPGDIFAEILLYLKNTYPVTAEAIENSVVLGIDAKKLFKTFQENPEFSMKMIGALAGRIKELLSKIENLTLDDVKERFLNYIYTLSAQRKSNEITLPASKGDIALMLGIRAETFSRIIKKLQNDGVIEVEGRKVRILRKDTNNIYGV